MENKIQSEYHWWLWNTYPLTRLCCYHVPMGFNLGEVVGAKLKAMGGLRGVPDYVHSIPANGYGALYIEFKDAGLIPKLIKSDHDRNQQKVQEALRTAGNKVVVCDSVASARSELLMYLHGTKYIQQAVVPIVAARK